MSHVRGVYDALSGLLRVSGRQPNLRRLGTATQEFCGVARIAVNAKYVPSHPPTLDLSLITSRQSAMVFKMAMVHAVRASNTD